MSRRSKRQSQADRRRNARRLLRTAQAGDMIAIGYSNGAYNVLIFPGDSKEAWRVFRGWEPYPRVDRLGQPMWHLEPIHMLLGPIVSITMTAPSLPLHIGLRGVPSVRQSFSERRNQEREAA